MPWTYSQRTGQLTHNGQSVATGYSDHGPGRNNPPMQAARGVGPTPLGTYSVGAPHHGNNTGSYTMNLDPQAGTDTFGRTLLRVHGDNPHHPGQSSDGCLMLPLAVRQAIWNSGDHQVQVAP